MVLQATTWVYWKRCFSLHSPLLSARIFIHRINQMLTLLWMQAVCLKRYCKPVTVTDYERSGGTSGAYLVQLLLKQGHNSQLSKTTSIWPLSISKKGDSTTSLHNLCQCLITLSKKVQFALPMFQFVPIATCPGTRHLWKVLGSICFVPSLLKHVDID